MRPLFEPSLLNDSFGDPGLYVDFRDERRALLFDFGDLGRLPPRKLLRLSHVFVSHTHMDHFAGFDQWLRVVLGRKDRIVLTGGPGFIERVGHKLAAYTWNVVHRYEVPLVIEAREARPGGGGRRAEFSSLARFERSGEAPWSPQSDVLLAEETFQIRACFLDHDIVVLAFALEEGMHVNVWKNRLAEMSLPTGPWLREARRSILADAPDDTPIAIRWNDHRGKHEHERSLGDLRDAFECVPGTRIGYVTDTRYTDANVAALDGLLADVDVLFIESVFLHADVAHAERKNHLTARQAGEIARRVRAKAVVPFHLSPRYEGRSAEVIAEVQAAWESGP
jgi:ribonuclease Z